jgi:site-specific recombinase XerD
MIEAGMGVATVQEILGHSSITVTEKYTHLRKRHLREAMEEMVERERQRRIG